MSFRFTLPLLSALFLSSACQPESDSTPDPIGIERMYTMRPAEIMRYGRAYAVDTLVFAFPRELTDSQSDESDAISGGFFEFSRGQTPDSMQAEQRALLFRELRGFESFGHAGMVPVTETLDLHSFSEQPSPDLAIKGEAATGLYLRHAASGFELVAPPLTELQRFGRGEVRGAIFAGQARVQSDAATPARRAFVLFERLYLPAANPYDENAVALWGQRARAWLLLPGQGGQLLLAREASPTLAPLYAADGQADRADFARLIRGDAAFAASSSFDAGTQAEFDSPAPGARRVLGASFALPGERNACTLELPVAHRHRLISMSRADSVLRLIAGGLLRCSRRAYPVFGLLRSWPAAN